MAVDVAELLKWLGTFTWEGCLTGLQNVHLRAIMHCRCHSMVAKGGRTNIPGGSPTPWVSPCAIPQLQYQLTTKTYNKHEMRAYIPRWRGEAEVVIAAGKVCV